MSAITIKSPREIEIMRQAGRITAAARSLAREMVTPGITTAQIDREVRHFIEKSGATPTFLGYGGYPASVCLSVNEEVIHGIPGKRVLKEGDIVSVDVGATYKGFVGDCAGTYVAGQASPEAQRLIDVTRQSFSRGSDTPVLGIASATYPQRSRNTLRRTASGSYAITSATVSVL